MNLSDPDRQLALEKLQGLQADVDALESVIFKLGGSHLVPAYGGPGLEPSLEVVRRAKATLQELRRILLGSYNPM